MFLSQVSSKVALGDVPWGIIQSVIQVLSRKLGNPFYLFLSKPFFTSVRNPQRKFFHEACL
jgi:hypothetical protein